MGSGLSMTSVNKIKELAAAREYSLALEIIESQDLTKSLNPQFIRLCGDVYVANGRYVDARKTFVRAHRMAPEAKRVIYSLVDLYLRMGYTELADFYYKLYMFDAEPNLPETNQLKYIYDKAQGCPLEEIETLLFPMYSDVMDYEWSYELYLLMKLQGKDAEARAIRDDYIATFKNESNVALMEELEQSTERLNELFYVYSKEKIEDDSPEEEQIRLDEKPLLEADDNRINPKEAQIQILFDDSEKATLGAKLKYKKHIKEQEKLAKKAGQGSEEEASGVGDSDGIDETHDSNEQSVEGEESDLTEVTETKVNIFKKIFSKKKNENVAEEISEDKQDISEEQDSFTNNSDVNDNIVSEETDNNVETNEHGDFRDLERETEFGAVALDNEDVDVQDDNIETVYVDNPEDEISGVEELDINDSSSEEICDEEVEVQEALELDGSNELPEENEELVDDTAAEYVSEYESEENIGDSVMQEIYGKKKISIVTEMGEDTFVNTENVEEVLNSGNPFKEMFNKTNDSDKVESSEESKTQFFFEDVELEPEDDEYEVDDFSSDIESFSFDSVGKSEASVLDEKVEDFNVETDVHTEANPEETGNVYDEYNFEFEDESKEIEPDNSAEQYSTVVDEASEEVEEKNSYDEYNVETDETPEEVDEGNSYGEYSIESDETPEEVEEGNSYDEYSAETEDDSREFKIEDSYDEYDVATDKVSEEIELDNFVEKYEKTVETGAISALDGESVYDSLKQKGSMDFPEFKSTLFPEFGQEVAEVENNFNEVMVEAQDKINENRLKEEQMQREAEALLASLGIDLGDIKPTIKPESTFASANGAETKTAVDSYVNEIKAETPETVEMQSQNNVEEIVYSYSPSRDELKSSLKIDSVKKNILKQIKEYR